MDGARGAAQRAERREERRVFVRRDFLGATHAANPLVAPEPHAGGGRRGLRGKQAGGSGVHRPATERDLRGVLGAEPARAAELSGRAEKAQAARAGLCGARQEEMGAGKGR